MTFYAWLRRQASRDDHIGDLAVDTMRDKCFPKRVVDPEIAVAHMEGSHQACPDAVRSMREAWAEYLNDGDRFRRD